MRFLSNGVNPNDIHRKPTKSLRELIINRNITSWDWKQQKQCKMKKDHWMPQILLARRRLRKPLSCKHILVFRNTQKAKSRIQKIEPKIMENYPQALRPEKLQYWLYLGRYRSVIPLCLKFSIFLYRNVYTGHLTSASPLYTRWVVRR